MTSLGQVSTGKKAAADTLADAFVIGPGIWSALVGADLAKKRQEVSKLGTHSIAVLKVGDQQLEHPMRTFLNANDRAALVKATSFKFLAEVFAKGKARPATEPERRFLYITIPFEIAGKPVTTIEVPGVVMLVVVENDRLFWIDSPNEYNSDGSLRNPIP